MTPPAGNMRLRASCDACNEARVRCSQTHPSCARCIKNGFNCVYGISQRAGRHRASSSRTSSERLSEPASEPSPPSQAAHSQPWPNLMDVAAGAVADVAPPAVPVSDLENISPLFDPWLSLRCSVAPDLDLDTLGPTPSTLPPSNPNDISRALSAVTDLSCNQNQSHNGLQNCVCVGTILSFILARPGLAYGLPTPIDDALVQGREAIKVCEQSLGCDGHHHRSFSLCFAFLLLLDRIMCFYEKVQRPPDGKTRGDRFSRGHNSHQKSDVVPTPTSSGLSLPGSDERGVVEGCHSSKAWSTLAGASPGPPALAAANICIGAYQLEPEDELGVQIHLICAHLHRLQKITSQYERWLMLPEEPGTATASASLDTIRVEDPVTALVLLARQMEEKRARIQAEWDRLKHYS